MPHTCWCGTPDHRKPQIFKGTAWCCERHRAIEAGELQPNQIELEVMPLDLAQKLGGVRRR